VPTVLRGDALAKWNELYPRFAAAGVLAGDLKEALALYCEAFGAWREAVRRIESTGYLTRDRQGTVIVSPWITVRDASADRMEQLAQKLGLVPSEPAASLLPPFAEYVDVV
jgi:P27 family predicted phage terminase small subunit